MPTEVKGALKLRKALREFAPDLAKETSKELGNLLKPVVRNARGFIPTDSQVPSGWLVANQKGKWERVAYNDTAVRRGIKYKTTPSKVNRSGFRALVSIFNTSPAGAIYETAGRKSGVRGRFTPKLGGQLDGKGQSMTGRAIFRAWDQDQGKTKGSVLKAIYASRDKFNATVKAK